MLIFCFHQHLENQRPKLWGRGVLVIWKFSIWCIFTKWWPFFDFFIKANANIPFPKWFNFPIITSFCPCFDFNNVSMLKRCMHGHSHMMTFLHLKVHNDWHKFSVGSVFPINFSYNVTVNFLIAKDCVRLVL